MKFKELKIGDIFFLGSPNLKYKKLSSTKIQYIKGGREIKVTEVDKKIDVFRYDE